MSCLMKVVLLRIPHGQSYYIFCMVKNWGCLGSPLRKSVVSYILIFKLLTTVTGSLLTYFFQFGDYRLVFTSRGRLVGGSILKMTPNTAKTPNSLLRPKN